jgi:hypothetical protein
MRDGVPLPVAAVALRPSVASSLAGGRCAATMEATGTRLAQLQGAATDATWVVVPRTVTVAGRVGTTDAFPSTVSVALILELVPRKKLPRTMADDVSFKTPGVRKSPPIVT